MTYLVMSKQSGQFFQIFVVFSKYLNFTVKTQDIYQNFHCKLQFQSVWGLNADLRKHQIFVIKAWNSKFWPFFCANVCKVQLFWEGHKNLHNLPHGFDIYLVSVKTMRKIAQFFVAFSEKLNFRWVIIKKSMI